MEQIFKGVESDLNEGDYIHISPNGQQAVILDGVTHKNPITAREITRDWLNQAYSQRARLQPSNVLGSLHALFQKNNCQGVIALITALPQRFQIDVVGNIQIITFREHLPPEVTPTNSNNFLGQPNDIKPESISFEHTSDCAFLVTSDGLDARAIQNDGLTLADFRRLTKSNLKKFAVEQDWTAHLFPYESARVRLDYQDIIFGTVEGEEHEVRGLRDICNAILTRSEFRGSKLIIGSLVSTLNHSRELDGILVCPFGVFTLELKDHAGLVEIDIDGNGPGSMRLYDRAGKPKHDTNPKAKLKKLIQALGGILKPLQIQIEATRNAAIVFTSSYAQVTCIDRSGNSLPLPQKSGEYLFCKTEQLLDGILAQAKQWAGRKLKPVLNEDAILTVAKLLYGDTQATCDNFPQLPGFEIDWNTPLVSESTPYFNVYKGTHYSDKIWIKEYNFSNLSEAARIERMKRFRREAHTLHRLNRRRVSGVPYYYETFSTEQNFYLAVEAAPERTLTSWISENPSRTERLTALCGLADLLAHVAQLTNPVVIHRGINPNNIRIADNNAVWLINYELVQDDKTGTIGADERSQFVNGFLPYEVKHNMEVRPSADIYSFFMCAYFILSGKQLANSTGEIPRRLRESEARFIQHLNELGFDLEQCNIWLSGLSPKPEERPSIHLVREAVQTWR